MFELSVKVKVESKDGHPGKTTVEHKTLLDGVEQKDKSEEFENVLMAYIFLGDFFYDMVERLVARSRMMGVVESLGTDDMKELN